MIRLAVLLLSVAPAVLLAAWWRWVRPSADLAGASETGIPDAGRYGLDPGFLGGRPRYCWRKTNTEEDSHD